MTASAINNSHYDKVSTQQPLYGQYYSATPKHTMPSARRERVTDHPLKSRSNNNSPLVVVPNQQILTDSTKVSTGCPTAAVVTGVRQHHHHQKQQAAGAQSIHDGDTSSHNSSSFATTINTASLIQSAARSVLDSVYTPTNASNVSDDEEEEEQEDCYVDDHENFSNGSDWKRGQRRNRHQYQQPANSQHYSNNDDHNINGDMPKLESLKKESLPSMPDEQDRKRFVGCLAAVLASAYDYDTADEEEDQTHAAESYAYLNKTEQGHDDDDQDEDDDYYHAYGDGRQQPERQEGANHEDNHHHNNNHTSSSQATAAGGEKATWDTSFIDDDEPSYLSNACSTSFEYSDVSQLMPDMINNNSNNSSTSEPSQSAHYRYNQNQQQQYASPRKQHRSTKKSTIARNRHRKRRYDLLSQLLLSSAELLLLDKSQARAFLPMLARLLMPPSASQKTNEFRIRQQQKQQEQQQQEQEQGGEENEQEALASDNSSINTTPTKSPSSLHSTSYNSPNRTTDSAGTGSPSSSPLSSSNNNDGDKGINHYHFSPTNAIPVSRQIPLPPSNNNSDLDYDNDGDFGSYLPNGFDEEDHLKPFLESLTPGAGYRCLSLLILQYLLHSAEGYDARIRHVVKKLGVIVLLHDMDLARDLELLYDDDDEDDDNDIDGKEEDINGDGPRSRVHRPKQQRQHSKYDDLVEAATRKFEGLEHSIAVRLIRLSKEQQRLQQAERANDRKHEEGRHKEHSSSSSSSRQQSEASSLALSREQFVRGLKIGSAGLVAGAVFAVTGGLAAPGIIAGVTAIAGSTAATAAVAALVSSTPAVTAIFGVGGGSLAAYKMNRRTQGLTEFEFQRQDKLLVDRTYRPEEVEEAQAELFSTVCISGWLRDEHDFQRPWGILPSNPRIRDRLELLERFYAVYKPDHVHKCKSLLQRWKGEEKQLWELLRQKYGRDPDHLYPIVSDNDSGSFHLGLTLEQEEVLNELFVELGYVADVKDLDQKHATKATTTSTFTFQDARQRLKHPFANRKRENAHPKNFNQTSHHNLSSNSNAAGSKLTALLDDSFQAPVGVDGLSCASSGFDSVPSSFVASAAGNTNSLEGEDEDKELPKHISTVWDYHSRYGGEVYTVKWESETLIEVCDSVTDLAFDLINGATAQLLRQTALHTLLNAVAVPYALVNAANMIDGSWTLVVERADEAGKELARSLLFSRAGHRPVTLVGFSFGARAIYSCLKELAKYQEKWETSRENNKNGAAGGCKEGDAVQGQGKDSYSWTLREPASIVEDAILMGLPNHLSLRSWRACRQVVGGRLVNCYSKKDYILSLMFQIKRLAGGLKPVCGACPVNVAGVENVDVSDLISGHQDYCLVTGEILKRVRHCQPFRSTRGLFSDANGALVTA